MPHCGSILVVVDLQAVSSGRLLQTVLLWQLYLYRGAHITRKRSSASRFRAQPGWGHKDQLCHQPVVTLEGLTLLWLQSQSPHHGLALVTSPSSSPPIFPSLLCSSCPPRYSGACQAHSHRMAWALAHSSVSSLSFPQCAHGSLLSSLRLPAWPLHFKLQHPQHSLLLPCFSFFFTLIIIYYTM